MFDLENVVLAEYARHTTPFAVRLPLLGGIIVNPVSPLGRRLVARHDQLWLEGFRLRRRVRAEWASHS